MRSTPTPLRQDLSERIAIARVLCILGMIYVHVPAGDTVVDYVFTAGDIFTTLQSFLVEGFGRAAACLLSVVSGFLVASSLNRGLSPAALYARRWRSIVLPMLLWSLVTVVLYGVFGALLDRPTFVTQIFTLEQPWQRLLGLLNVSVFLTDMPNGAATQHLAFLRDLFVCVLLAPLLLALLRQAGTRWSLLAGLTVLYLLDLESVVVLRPLVILAFTVGMYLAQARVELDRADRLLPLWLVGWIVSTSVLLAFNAGTLAGLDALFADVGLDAKESLLYPFSRLFGSLSLWCLTGRLLSGRTGMTFSLVSPYIFTAFCSHLLVLSLLFMLLWQPVFGDAGNALYPVWFLSAPLLALAAAVVMVQVTVHVYPSLARLMTGGRCVTPIAPPTLDLLRKRYRGWLLALGGRH